MTESERQARTRVCESGHTWLAFGARGESCAWCSPSIPDDARQLSLQDLDEDEEASRAA